ncbi:MAG: hypothetical protein WC365_07615 [Candidatus Babeliales bacterium]
MTQETSQATVECQRAQLIIIDAQELSDWRTIMTAKRLMTLCSIHAQFD